MHDGFASKMGKLWETSSWAEIVGPTAAGIQYSAWVGNIRVNPGFHPTSVQWNLGLTWEFPTLTIADLVRHTKDIHKTYTGHVRHLV